MSSNHDQNHVIRVLPSAICQMQNKIKIIVGGMHWHKNRSNHSKLGLVLVLVVCNAWDVSDLSTQTIENKILPSSTGLEKLSFFKGKKQLLEN